MIRGGVISLSPPVGARGEAHPIARPKKTRHNPLSRELLINILQIYQYWSEGSTFGGMTAKVCMQNVLFKAFTERMEGVNGLAKILSGQMGINLCGSDGGMSQHLLNGPEIRPTLYKMGGK